MSGGGPVGDVLSGLRRVGTGERVLKTALAVGLAWQLGTMVPNVGSPYLAPLAALLTMQITIADSLTAASQRVLGIVVGVTVAIAISAVVGINGLTVGLLVLIAFATGSALRLGPQGIQQVAISAMLLVGIGSVSSVHYAVARIVETIVGVSVGLIVNALLAPPSHLGTARDAVAIHAAAVAAVMDHLAESLAAGITPGAAVAVLDESRATDALLRAAQDAVQRTETALKYNLWNHRERPQAQRLAQSLRAQGRAAMQARGIVRTVEESTARAAPARPGWLEPNAFAGNLPEAISGIAGLLRSFPTVMLAPEDSPEAVAFANRATTIEATRSGLAADPRVASLVTESDAWIPLGSILADLGRIRRELGGAVADRDRAFVPPPLAPSDSSPHQAEPG